jgi:hypothetical protein
VIVRISNEGQYELGDDLGDRLNELDNAVVAAVESGDEAQFRAAFEQLLEYVRAQGSEVSDDDLRESSLILPPEDLTLDEAGNEFTGDGLIPD